MLFPCNAVFEVQPVFIGMQIIIRNADFSAFGYDDGDFIAVYRYNVEYDGIFSVEKLKFFEIKFVFLVNLLLVNQFIPDGIFDFDFTLVVTGKLAAAVSRFVFYFAHFVMYAFVFAVAVWYRMAAFNAIFKHADIRIAFLTDAGDNQVFIGDETDAGHLVASKLIQFGNAVNYFFHWFLYLRFFYFFLSAGKQKARRELKSQYHFRLFRKSTGTRKIIAYMSRKTFKNAKKPSRSNRPTRLSDKIYIYVFSNNFAP